MRRGEKVWVGGGGILRVFRVKFLVLIFFLVSFGISFDGVIFREGMLRKCLEIYKGKCKKYGYF